MIIHIQTIDDAKSMIQDYPHVLSVGNIFYKNSISYLSHIDLQQIKELKWLGYSDHYGCCLELNDYTVVGNFGVGLQDLIGCIFVPINYSAKLYTILKKGFVQRESILKWTQAELKTKLDYSFTHSKEPSAIVLSSPRQVLELFTDNQYFWITRIGFGAVTDIFECQFIGDLAINERYPNGGIAFLQLGPNNKGSFILVEIDFHFLLGRVITFSSATKKKWSDQVNGRRELNINSITIEEILEGEF